MVGEESEAKLRGEIRILDEELAALRRTVDELRSEMGERRDGPVDAEERSADMVALEEQQALIGILDGRRTDLLGKLGHS